MIALSLKQPWASLVITGQKPIETREWPFFMCSNLAKLHNSRLAIHASKSLDFFKVAPGADRGSWPRGGIIGSVLVKGHKFYETAAEFNAEKHLHLCSEMNDVDFMLLDQARKVKLGIILADPRPCDFIPARGSLGFFECGVTV